MVERIAKAQGCKVSELIGQQQRLQQLRLEDYCDAQFGLYTLRDIIRELEKPGRDPRPEFRTASFQEGVETLADLHPGMQLEGCVTNVTNFGAFVDIGVHQDGLVHISQLADRFVKDPHSIVKPAISSVYGCWKWISHVNGSLCR
nr:S1 RNA-binding domain-containing protein [Aliamphritea spongicola]